MQQAAAVQSSNEAIHDEICKMEPLFDEPSSVAKLAFIRLIKGKYCTRSQAFPLIRNFFLAKGYRISDQELEHIRDTVLANPSNMQ